MMDHIKRSLLAVGACIVFFSCSGQSDTSTDEQGDTLSPPPVSEMDRSRYNLNEPDEMLHEMQDSTDMQVDTLID